VTGDVLIAVVDALHAPVIVAPPGWTLIRSDLNPGGLRLEQGVYLHVVSGVEPVSYGWGFSASHGASGGILAVRGVDPVSPIEATSGGVSSAAQQVSAPSATATTPSSLVVGAFGAQPFPALTVAGMTPRSQAGVSTVSGERVTTLLADAPLTSSGPSGARTASAPTAFNGIAQLIVLRPLQTSNPPPPPPPPPTGTVIVRGGTTGMPSGIAACADGSVWFTEENTGGTAVIGRVNAAGVVSEINTPISGNLGGIACAPDSSIWFTGFDANSVVRRSPAGVFRIYPMPTAGSGLAGVTVGTNGTVWLAEALASKLARLDPTTGSLAELPTPTPSAWPRGINVAPDGTVWFAELNANRLGKIIPSGTITEYPIPTPASNPRVVATAPGGNIWFTEFSGNKIGRMTPAGAFTEYPVPTPAAQPVGITIAHDGNVWFTEQATGKIGRITPSGQITEYPLPSRTAGPDKITTAPDGTLWFTVRTSRQIATIAP
jgi:streptogramin lyase